MVKEEIVEGLKVAVNKGETLKQAMMSFYNSGYNKEDIEEAAKTLATMTLQQRPKPVIQPTTQPKPQTPIQPSQPQTQAKLQVPIQQPEPILQTQRFRQLPKATSGTVQTVSNYGKKPRAAGFIITLILVFLLLSLLGLLAAVFFFKEELTQFFNNVL